MGVYTEAIKAYKKSLKIDEAVAQLFTLVDKNENDFYANYYLGKTLRYSITDEDSAVTYFKKAKKVLLSSKDKFSEEQYTIFMDDIKHELEK